MCSDKGLRGIVSSISAILLMLTASFCMCPFHSGTGLFCLLEQAMLQVPIMCISTWPSSADCHNLYTYTNIHKYRLHKNAFVCIHCLVGHCSKMWGCIYKVIRSLYSTFHFFPWVFMDALKCFPLISDSENLSRGHTLVLLFFISICRMNISQRRLCRKKTWKTQWVCTTP